MCNQQNIKFNIFLTFAEELAGAGLRYSAHTQHFWELVKQNLGSVPPLPIPSPDRPHQAAGRKARW